jgi:DNA-binding NtrC family response regulator
MELAATLDEGLARVKSGDLDVVVADLYLDSRSALELVDQLRTQDPHLPVIIMTAKHTTDTAIEATKLK